MSLTVEEIRDEAFRLVGEVAGPGVQMFSDDVMREHVVRGFNLLFKKYPWPHFRKWFLDLALDGTTGVLAADTFDSNWMQFEDILGIHVDGEDYKLPMLQTGRNPKKLTGSRALVWTSLPTTDIKYKKRRIQFYPKTATSVIDIEARIYPLTAPKLQWGLDDVMELDNDLLVFASAFMALTVDGMNPEAANVVKGFMEEKYGDITGQIARNPIHLTGNPGLPTQWYERI